VIFFAKKEKNSATRFDTSEDASYDASEGNVTGALKEENSSHAENWRFGRIGRQCRCILDSPWGGASTVWKSEAAAAKKAAKS
jgi:hypothetical protein